MAGRIQKGFTLMELLLVATIFVVAAAVAVPNFVRTTAKFELKQAAEDMANAIRYGQLRAISKGRPQRLNIDARGYWLEEDGSFDKGQTQASVNPAFERIKEASGRRVNFPSGIRLTQDGDPIVISPDGRMAAASLRLCRQEQCLIVSTTQQRGHVDVLDPELTETHETL